MMHPDIGRTGRLIGRAGRSGAAERLQLDMRIDLGPQQNGAHPKTGVIIDEVQSSTSEDAMWWRLAGEISLRGRRATGARATGARLHRQVLGS